MQGLGGIGPLIWQRFAASWRLLAVLGFGVLVASTLLAVAPVYTRVMNDLGLQSSLEQQLQSSTRNGFTRFDLPLGSEAAVAEQRALTSILADEVSWFSASEVRYAALTTLTFGREGQAATATDRFRMLADLQTMSGVDSYLRVVDGRLAQATSDPARLEAVMPAETARLALVKPGDRIYAGLSFDDCNRPAPTQDPEQARENARFACVPQTNVDLRANITIVGIVDKAGDERYWNGTTGISFAVPQATETSGPQLVVILPEQSFFQALPRVLPGLPYQYRLTAFADVTKLDSANLDRAKDSLDRVAQRVEARGGVPDVAMRNGLIEFKGRASFNQVPLVILLLQVIGIAVYYVLLVSSLLAERRAVEVAMLRSRGASVWQVVVLSAAEASIIGVAAAVVAPFIASGAVAALGKTGTFESVSDGDWLAYTIVPSSFLYALGGAAIAALAVVAPAFFAARQGMVLFLRSAARPGKPLLQRYYLDFGLVGLAALGLWELNQRGTVFDASSVGGWSADPLFLLSPLLLIMATGAMMFRFLPLILRLVSRIVATTSGPGMTLGIWQLTRSPARYTQLALLVVMAAAVGTFAATYGETTDRSQEEQALYAVGTDVRLGNLGRLDRESSESAAKALLAVPGVEAAGTAYRASLGLGPLPNFGEQFPILGLDPDAAPDLLWFREDFAAQSLRSLLSNLKGSTVSGSGIILPGEPVSLSLWAAPSTPRPGTTLWVRTRDGRGVFRLHELGSLDFDGYRLLETRLNPSDGFQYPISMVGLIMTQASSLNDGQANMVIDDITSVEADGRTTVVEDFEGNLRWDALRTATRNRDVLVRGGRPHSGSGAAQFGFRTGTGTGVRGMLVTDPNIPIPAIASKRFMERTGLQSGAEVEFVLGNVLVPMAIRGTVDLFPTMVEPERGFLLINQDALFYYSALTLQNSGLYPNEGWLKLNTNDPAQRTAIIDKLRDQYGIAMASIVDRQTVLKSVQSDPVVRAGGSGILLLALVAAFSVLALGFALTLYLGGQGRSVEVSVMRAVGLSSRQVLIMITLEYMVIAVSGLVIGTIAGLRISDTMLSFLNVTQGGGRVVPPFSLATQWDTVGVAFLAAGIAFVAGVLGLVAYFLRLPVSRVLRLTR